MGVVWTGHNHGCCVDRTQPWVLCGQDLTMGVVWTGLNHGCCVDRTGRVIKCSVLTMDFLWTGLWGHCVERPPRPIIGLQAGHTQLRAKCAGGPLPSAGCLRAANCRWVSHLLVDSCMSRLGWVVWTNLSARQCCSEDVRSLRIGLAWVLECSTWAKMT